MECRIISLPQLDNMPLRQVGQYLDSHVEHEVIGCVNWCNDFPYKPYSTFVIAVSATRLYVFFSVISKDLRAVNTVDLSPVADDSCVEFFMQLPGNEEWEAPARVVECPHDCAGRDTHGIRAEAVVAFSGHECSVDDEFDSFHFFVLLLRLSGRKKFLLLRNAFGMRW